MSVVLSHFGMVSLLEMITDGTDNLNGGTWYSTQLFSNNVSISIGTGQSQFTLISSGLVAALQILTTNWGSSTINGDEVAESDNSVTMTWTNNDATVLPQTVWGYIVFVHGDSTNWLWAEKFATAVTFSSLGDSITITPKLTLGQCS